MVDALAQDELGTEERNNLLSLEEGEKVWKSFMEQMPSQPSLE